MHLAYQLQTHRTVSKTRAATIACSARLACNSAAVWRIGALLACRDQDICVPEQLSIIGFDDILITDYVNPPLTTIHQPKIRLGSLAMETLLALLDGKTVENHILQPTLTVRASTTQAKSSQKGDQFA